MIYDIDELKEEIESLDKKADFSAPNNLTEEMQMITLEQKQIELKIALNRLDGQVFGINKLVSFFNVYRSRR